MSKNQRTLKITKEYTADQVEALMDIFMQSYCDHCGALGHEEELEVFEFIVNEYLDLMRNNSSKLGGIK